MPRHHPVAIFLLLPTLLLQADPPKLDALYPSGGERGETLEVKAIGTFGAWPPKVWTDHPDLSIVPKEKKGLLEIAVKPDARIRPALIRIIDFNGSSQARTFVISQNREFLETESNNHRKRAQDLNVTRRGIVVNGILKRDDSDFFHIHLRKGQTLNAEVDGYSLGSMIDPFLSLLDPLGHEVALASDTHNLDPKLSYKAEVCGPHYLQLFAVSHPAATFIGYAGSDSSTYRLSLSLGNKRPKELEADFKEYELREANGSRLIPRQPASVEGFLSNGHEVDSYVFEAKKRQKLQFSVYAQSLGLITDPVFSLHRPSGTLLKEVDDGKGTRDSSYLSSAMPEDGNYTLKVWDRFDRGGKPFRYLLEISNPLPELVANSNKEVLVLEANGTASLKLNLTRSNGNKNPLRIRTVPPLPKGVTLEDANASGKASQVELTFRATPEAGPANLPLRLRVIETEDDNSTNRSFATRPLVYGSKKGDYLVNQTTWLHLTVKPAPPPEKAKDDKEDEKAE